MLPFLKLTKSVFYTAFQSGTIIFAHKIKQKNGTVSDNTTF